MKTILSIIALTFVSVTANAKEDKQLEKKISYCAEILSNGGGSVVDVTVQCKNAATAAVNTLQQFGIENTMQENGYTLSQNVWASTYFGCIWKQNVILSPR